MIHIRNRKGIYKSKSRILSKVVQFFYKLLGCYRTKNYKNKRLKIYVFLRLFMIGFLMHKFLPLSVNFIILCIYCRHIGRMSIFHNKKYENNSSKKNILETILLTINSSSYFIPHFPFFMSLIQSIIIRFKMKNKATYFYVIENKRTKKCGKLNCTDKKNSRDENEMYNKIMVKKEKIYFEGFFHNKKLRKKFERDFLCECYRNAKTKSEIDSVKQKNDFFQRKSSTTRGKEKPYAVIIQHGYNSTSGNKNVRSLCYSLANTQIDNEDYFQKMKMLFTINLTVIMKRR